MSLRAHLLLPMKCLALRIGDEFQDLQDIRVLVRAAGIRKTAEVILTRYYAAERYPLRAPYVPAELLFNETAEDSGKAR